MSTNEQTPLSQPTPFVRNTLGKEQVPQNLGGSISDEALREYCDKNYHQILPIIAKKVHQEKLQQEKLKAVKAHLNFEESSRRSELGTPSRMRDLKERFGPRQARSRSRSPDPRRDGSKLPKEKGPEIKTVFKRLEKGVFHRLGDKEKSVSAYSRDSKHRSSSSSRRDVESYYQGSRSKGTELASEKHRNKRVSSRNTEALPESEGSVGGHWKSRPKRQKSSVEDDLSQPWKKCIKDPVEIHNNKKRDGESTEESCGVDEMMRVTTASLRGEVEASNYEWKKSFPSWKQQETRQKQNFKKGSFRSQQRTERRQDKFTFLTKTPKEIMALDKGKFKHPLPMTTPIKKR
nr:reverse transcriptase domain-containing protein [Tanacetum cinerariifolium]